MKAKADFDKILKDWSYPFQLFEKYLNNNKHFLKQEIKNINKELNEKQAGKPIEVQIDLENTYNEFYLNYLAGTFPDIQNKSALIILYNTIETTLVNLCKTLEEKLNTPLKHSDLHGHILEKCKKYLVKVIGIKDDVFKTETWEKIDAIREIRNCIVHNESNISQISKKGKKYVKDFTSFDGFILVNNVVGITNIDFLNEFLRLIKVFFDELIEELNNTQKLELN